ncbi:FAD/NAD(P)-binding domain-containing protein [Stipitochalara longipes BDJ]|nr:FAD/NAD(P)-binding domain-containing protein [Stipitochalara longipes BDJ]
MNHADQCQIIIVGAGPAGLLLGILLAKQGISITILEANTELDRNPRAAHYASIAIQEMRRAGILEDVQKEGYIPEGVCWREFDGTYIAGIRSHVDDPEVMICLPLDKLLRLYYRHFQKEPTGELLWQHKVVGIEQDDGEARVICETPGGTKTLGADYVLGCDGANSQIRKSLFGKEYPGETLHSQIIATNVYYDFHKFGYWDSNFIVHPEDWYMAAKITPDGMWRVTYGDKTGLSTKEYLERQPMRYEQLLPGNPKPGDYKLMNASPYKLQQRCAPSFRVGRFILVADAAHLCNPFGGMGLTGGFADITSLYDCLMAMQNGLTTDKILDKYSEIRIKKWAEIIDPVSRGNFRRLWAEDAIPERLAFFEMCKKMETDEEMQKGGAAVSDLRCPTR